VATVRVSPSESVTTALAVATVIPAVGEVIVTWAMPLLSVTAVVSLVGLPSPSLSTLSLKATLAPLLLATETTTVTPAAGPGRKLVLASCLVTVMSNVWLSPTALTSLGAMLMWASHRSKLPRAKSLSCEDSPVDEDRVSAMNVEMHPPARPRAVRSSPPSKKLFFRKVVPPFLLV